MYRCHWLPPGSPFPAWMDFPSENDANRFALSKSREIRDEVAVIEIKETQ